MIAAGWRVVLRPDRRGAALSHPVTLPPRRWVTLESFCSERQTCARPACQVGNAQRAVFSRPALLRCWQTLVALVMRCRCGEPWSHCTRSFWQRAWRSVQESVSAPAHDASDPLAGLAHA